MEMCFKQHHHFQIIWYKKKVLKSSDGMFTTETCEETIDALIKILSKAKESIIEIKVDINNISNNLFSPYVLSKKRNISEHI